MRLRLKRKYQKKKGFKKSFISMLLIMSGLIVAFFYFFNMAESTILREVAQSELESIAFDIVGHVVEEELARDDADYSNLVNIERDKNGKVSAITTDTTKLNMLKLRVGNRLSEEMFDRTEDIIKIPVGNLTGIDFLTGIGPDLTFRTMWVSSVDGEFSNSFEDAGINQTRHQIMLDFTINVGMMFAGREIGVDVGTSICVAETIIVGDTPNFFAGK